MASNASCTGELTRSQSSRHEIEGVLEQGELAGPREIPLPFPSISPTKSVARAIHRDPHLVSSR
jgi:hypothetical protein